MPVAQEKTSLLIDEINGMIPSTLDEDRIREIEREAALLQQSGFYADAKQIEGMIAGLRKDVKGVHQKFNAALKSSGSNAIIMTNYAHALSNLRCLREAVEVADSAVELSPDDLSVLINTLDIHEHAYDFAGCDRIIEKITRLGASEKISPATLEKIEEMRAVVQFGRATWQDISERIELAARTLFSLGLNISSISETVNDDCVLMEFGVVGDAEASVEAERAIHLSIAARPYSPADSSIAFACLPE